MDSLTIKKDVENKNYNVSHDGMSENEAFGVLLNSCIRNAVESVLQEKLTGTKEVEPSTSTNTQSILCKWGAARHLVYLNNNGSHKYCPHCGVDLHSIHL